MLSGGEGRTAAEGTELMEMLVKTLACTFLFFWPDRIAAWMIVLSFDTCSDLPVIFSIVLPKTKRVEKN